ncbi:MAG: hypothetical protein QXL14_02150 [Candidatus Aenigmatarchaeota archaeon]
MDGMNGKYGKVIYMDGENHYSKKEGLIIGIESGMLFIRTDKLEAIPIHRIIRIEV